MTLAEPYFDFQPDSEANDLRGERDPNRPPLPEVRLALLHDRSHTPAPLVSTLAGHGLPPTSGVLPLDRDGELAARAPAVIVLAADLRHSGGLAAVRRLRRVMPASRIVVVAHDPGTVFGRQAINAGADAFVLERDAAQALGPAVHAALAGLICVPRVARRLVAKPTFSHREKQVLELLVVGMTNLQIAERLYLSESTIKSHVATGFAKLGVRSRKDAAAILLDPAEGLIGVAVGLHVRASRDVLNGVHQQRDVEPE